MSRLINRLCGRVYGWFESKEAEGASRRLPSRYSRRARLMLQDLEERAVPATFTVTNTDDTGAGSLRQAFIDANAAAGNDLIVFNTDIGLGTDFSVGPNTISLATTLPVSANQDITVYGPGADRLTITASAAIRMYAIPATQTFEIRDVTISGFNFATGGAITNAAGGFSNLIINRVHVTGNTASSTGGAFYLNAGNHQVLNSTISNNINTGATGGGGIRIFGAGANSLLVFNSTISGNSAVQGGGISISSSWAGTMNIVNSTIVGNTGSSATTTAGNGVGGIGRYQTATTAVTINLDNSIVAGNVATNALFPDMSFTGTTFPTVNATNSLIGTADTVTLTGNTNNKTGTVALPLDAKLGTLGLNGGLTPTHVPTATSDAVNLYTGAAAGVDQRGQARPAAAADAGAVERQGAEPPGEPPIALGFPTPSVLVDDATTNPYVFSIPFYNTDTADFDGADIRVTGPNSFSALASFVSFTGNSTYAVAKYSLTPPVNGAAGWDASDVGTYTVSAESGQIETPLNVALPPQALTAFRAIFPTTYAVTNTGDSGAGSLRQAILDANFNAPAKDTIVFDASFSTAKTINLLNALPTISDSLTITGPGSALLTLQRNASVVTAMTMLPIAGTGTLDVAVSGIRIVGNTASAITASDEIVTLTDLNISGVSLAGSGGGVNMAAGGTLTVSNSTITGNSVSASGGAIFAAGSSAIATSITIDSSTLDANTANTSGGGVAFTTLAGKFNLTITNSTISRNLANTATATSGGGGVYFAGTVDTKGVLVRNSTISGNSAVASGGGLGFNVIGAINIQNTTIVNNMSGATAVTVGVGGGGIALTASAATLSLESVIVSGNTAAVANGRDDIASVAATIHNVDFCAIADPDGFIINGTNTNNLLNADSTPTALVLGPFGFNGGTTKTHYLGKLSKALDVGSNPVNVTPALTVDQTGNARVVGAQIDIGAYERNPNIPTGVIGALPNISKNLPGTNNPYQFSVTYTDDTAMNHLTLDGSEIQISRDGGGFSTTASVVSLTPPGTNTSPITALYQFTPPGGGWDSGDNGFYSVTMLANDAKNTGGFAVMPGVMGNFRVSVGATFTVTNTGDNGGVNPAAGAGTGTLRQAIVDANADAFTPDEIVFDASFNSAQTINLEAALPTVSASVNITGKGSNLLTVQRKAGVATAMSILTLGGTGILDVAASGMKMIGNTSTVVVTSDENMTLSDMYVTGASTGSAGGGIRVGANNTGKLVMTNSTVTGNTSTTTSTSSGGGIAAYGGTTVSIDSSTISDNSSAGSGGGINFGNFTIGQNFSLTNSTVSGNRAGSATATYGGGGIMFVNAVGAGGVLIRNSTISGNSAGGSGGGVNFRLLNGTVNIQNSTIVNNVSAVTATTDGVGGGGIALPTITTGATLNIVSTIVSGNSAAAANGRGDVAVITTGVFNANFSAIGDADGFVLGGGSGNNLSTADSSPAALVLGPLNANGGPTRTHHLGKLSKALDAGDNPTNITPALTKDQTGNARVVGAQIDIGAYERDPNIPIAVIGALSNVNKNLPGTNNPYQFSVTYTDDAAMSFATLDGSEIQISRVGGGFTTTATVVSLTPPATDTSPITALYQFTPPGGGWDPADNGFYNVDMLANDAKNTGGFAVRAALMGSFRVAIGVTFTVTNTGDNGGVNPAIGAGTGTLRQAIVDANADPLTFDEIVFDASFATAKTIDLEAVLPTIAGSVVITGKGSNLLTVQRKTGVATVMSILPIAGAGIIDVSVSGMKMIGNTASAVSTSDEIVALTDVHISGVSLAGSGGAISVLAGGAVSVTNSTLTGNSVSTNGGAINVAGSNVTSTSLTIHKTTISNNTAATSGGGISMTTTTGKHSLFVTDSSIWGNRANSVTTTAGGGGIFFAGVVDGKGVLIRNTTVSSNLAVASGGGILFNTLTGTVNIQNSTLTANESQTVTTTVGIGGGGIAIVSGTTPTMNLVSTILSGNTANVANGRGDLATIAAAVNVVTFSAIGDPDGFTLGAGSGNNLSTADSSKASLNLGPLGAFGGPTKSHFLATPSTADGKGTNPSNITPALTTDQTGGPRVQNGVIEIGSFEINPNQPLAFAGSLPNVVADSPGVNNPYKFTVTYSDATAMDHLTIDGSEITVSRQGGGFSILASLVSLSPPATNAPTIVATYQFTPPGGAWDGTDNGKYDVILAEDDVKNTNAAAVFPGTLGTFTVGVPLIILVTNNADSGAGSLRTAMTSANAATGSVDIINFDPAFFDGSAGKNNIALLTALPGLTEGVIINGPGKALLTISGKSTLRHFDTSPAAANSPITIKNLRLTGGSIAATGGSILIGDEAVTLENVTIESNTSTSTGGAVHITTAPGALTVVNSLIQNNKATSNGGAIHTAAASPVITVSGSTISSNTSSGAGGAIYLSSTLATLTINNSIFANNSAAGNGGAIDFFNSSWTLSMNNSSLTGNTSGGTQGGGAIYAFSTTLGANINNTTISNNIASNTLASSNGGGGIRLTSATGTAVNIRNSTIMNNTALAASTAAGAGGGGISGSASLVNLISTVVAGNSAASANTDLSFTSTPNINFSAVGTTTGYTASGTSGNNIAPGTDLKIDATAAANGGTNGLTHAIQTGSPLLNAGSNPLGLTTDQRGAGFARSVPSLLASDIGAFERVPTAPEAASTPFVNINVGNAAASDPYFFDVIYYNNVAINAGTLGGDDVRITGPGGFDQLAQFVSSTPPGNATEIKATYKFSAPGGGWTPATDGTYTIAVEAGKVADINTVTVGATTLGTFNVLIGKTYVVTNTKDSGAGSLRQAVIDANTDAALDLVTFDSSFSTQQTITLTSGLLSVTESLFITGPAAGVNVSGNKASRVFSIDNAGSIINVELSRLNIMNGTVSGAGGAIIITNETVTLTDCTVTGSTSTGNGGGIALTTSPGKLNLVRTTVSGNAAGGNGGGLDTGAFGGIVSLTDSTIANNFSINNGGGLGQAGGGSITLLRTTVSGNTAGGHSGAFYLNGSLAFTADNSTLSGNVAGTLGGAINFTTMNLNATFRNSTVTANSASTSGGGFNRASGAGTVNLISTIFAGNLAPTGPDLNFAAATALNANNSLIGVGDSGSFSFSGTSGANQTGSLGTPLNPGLSLLGSYGGLTKTHALTAKSTAVDTGANPNAAATDQRGSPREDPTGLPDIGAYERVHGVPTAAGGPFVTIDNANAALQDPYVFTITWANDANIDVASFGDADIRIIGPAGFNKLATFVSSGGNALSVDAVYKVAAPAGGWTNLHSGVYTISAEAGEVSSVNGKSVAATGIGTFFVAISGNFLVTNTNDSGAGSLREALNGANQFSTADTITFSSLFDTPQTITLTTGELFVFHPVTITGKGASLTTVTPASGRVFNTTPAAAGAAIAFEKMTITGGISTNGGNIFITDENVTINDCVVSNGLGTSSGGNINLTASGAMLTINRSTISGGTSGAGGGVFMAGGTSILVQNSTLVSNATTIGNTGGAIRLVGAFGTGGFTIRNTTISGNSSGFHGGGIGFTSLSGNVNIINCTITNNTAAGNVASNGGGIGINAATGTVTLVSTIVAGNTIGGPDPTKSDIGGSLATPSTFNINFSAIGTSGGYTLSGTSGNNAAVGADLKLKALANNGGATMTHAFGVGSALFNAGSNPAPALLFDQRGTGFAREQPTGFPDIGAFERTPGVPDAVAGTLVNVNIDDFTTNPYSFSVTYSDDAAIDVATVINNNNAIRVTGPGGFDITATYNNIDDNTNGSPRTAFYNFLPPGGTWNFPDNGNYTIEMKANQVKSTLGGAVAAGTLGTFNVGFAGTYLVTNANDSGAGSFRAALAGANSSLNTPDIIAFDPGFFNTSMKTIQLLSALPGVTDTVTINGPGANLVTLSGEGAFRVLNFSTAPAGTVLIINNMTLANGSTNGVGGAIFIGDELVTLDNMVLQNNRALEGGAISLAASAASLTITNSRLLNNTATEDGGAIDTPPAAAPPISITASTLSGNLAGSDGGAIYFANGGSLNLIRSTVSGNTANGTGGAFNLGGGGIYFFGPIGVNGFRIHNSTISNNTHASLPGGGLALAEFTGSAEILNSTFVGNKATNGGGIARVGIVSTGTLTITSSVVAGNTTSGGAALDISFGVATVNGTFSAVGTDPEGSMANYSISNNIPFGTPLFLGALASNGGPTQTHLPATSSPLLNVGSNPSPLTPDVDQIGNPRTFGVQTDIGAVEVQAPATIDVVNYTVNDGAAQRSRITTITITFTGTVNPANFTALGAITLTRTAATPTGVVGTIVQTGATGANGLITVTQPGPVNQLVLTFSNANGANETAGVEYGSLADGRWRLAVPSSLFTSTLNDVNLRRLFGDFEPLPAGSNGTVDAGDFGQFGGVFGASGTPGFSPFDYDNNGTIDSGDLAAFGARFGFSV